jgi:hypothetical protein
MPYSSVRLAGTYADDVTRAAATPAVTAGGVRPAANATPGTAPASAMPTTAMLPATARLIRKNLVMHPTPSPLGFRYVTAAPLAVKVMPGDPCVSAVPVEGVP